MSGSASMTMAPLAGQRILIVDDNPVVSSMLRHGLTAEGYEVAVAADGRAALETVAHSPPDLVLLDVDLPHVPGDEICRRLKTDPATRLIPVVMITAAGGARNKLAAWEYGADEFLPKPFHLVEVVARCRSLLHVKRLIEERDSAEAVVFALARAVEAKSPFTHGHSERVARCSLALADVVGVKGPDRELLRKGALLHDIGKISIPDAILNKPGPLTDEEYALVKQHPVQGAHIVEPLASVRAAIPLIRWHHERMDGTGYSDRLTDSQIPRLVRILTIADVYDSLASDRPYRDSIPHAACLDMLRENALGGGLDLELVACFSEIAEVEHQRRSGPRPAICPTAVLG